MFRRFSTNIFVLVLFAAVHLASAQNTDWKFSFAPSASPGYTLVQSSDVYSPDHGFGFDLGSKVQAESDCVTSVDGKPFFFSVKIPPGEYQVTLTLGGAAPSTTTVKSETRRLMLQAIQTAPGQIQKQTFLVHVRVPQIPDGGMVAFKDREKLPILYVQWDDATRVPFTELDWDEKLTLEFSDSHPAVQAIEITPAVNPITIYLIGDSTMTDQMMEPWAAWGQMFPRFFTPPVVIANYAECGETTRSFIGEHRWAKVMSEIHPGDFVLMQFGINDRSIQLPAFKQYFVQFITDTRAHGATPVLVTSQNLRKLDADGKAVQTLGGYPDAMRQVAADQKVALIDLNAMSMKLYEAIGPEKLPKFFVDGTHHSDFGAYELSKCVVQASIDAKLPFAQYVVPDWTPFDPSHPDAMDEFKLPPDPQLDPARPGGPGAPDGRGPMAGAIQRGGRRGATTRPTAG